MAGNEEANHCGQLVNVIESLNNKSTNTGMSNNKTFSLKLSSSKPRRMYWRAALALLSSEGREILKNT